MNKKRLSDIPTDDHPFNWDRYSQLLEEIRSISAAFNDTGHMGLASLANEVGRGVYRLWDAVVDTETLEKSNPVRMAVSPSEIKADEQAEGGAA